MQNRPPEMRDSDRRRGESESQRTTLGTPEADDKEAAFPPQVWEGIRDGSIEF